MEILEKLTKAVNYAFRADGTGPGITVAWLRHNQSYYVSIIRWINGEKVVEKSASSEKLEIALKELSYKFLENVPPPVNPIDELADLLTDKKSEKPIIDLPWLPDEYRVDIANAQAFGS